MPGTIEDVAIYDACRLLKESLYMDSSFKIEPDELIKNIESEGSRADFLNILEIFHKFGFDCNKYFTGERFTAKGREMIIYALKEDKTDRSELLERINKSEIISISDVFEYLTPRMLGNASIFAYMNMPMRTK